MTPREWTVEILGPSEGNEADWWPSTRDLADVIERAIADAVAAERERCVKIIEHPNAGLVPPDGGDPTPAEMLSNIAAAIRALD